MQISGPSFSSVSQNCRVLVFKCHQYLSVCVCVCVLSPSGYMLIGCDVKLNSPMSLVGQALAEILQYPERARDALRVLLHLVRNTVTLFYLSLDTLWLI